VDKADPYPGSSAGWPGGPTHSQSYRDRDIAVIIDSVQEATRLLLAWLHNHAELIGFPRLHRLIGLCNLLGKGDWDLWGAPLGKGRSLVKEVRIPG
jgi:hypothetical protein